MIVVRRSHRGSRRGSTLSESRAAQLQSRGVELEDGVSHGNGAMVGPGMSRRFTAPR
jgi:hypothetical protein